MMINNKDEAWSFGGNANGVQGIGLKSQDPTYPHKVGEQVANGRMTVDQAAEELDRRADRITPWWKRGS